MATATTTATISFGASIKLNEAEANVMSTLALWGADTFVKHFSTHLGADLDRLGIENVASLFEAIKRDVAPALQAIKETRRDLQAAAEKRLLDSIARTR